MLVLAGIGKAHLTVHRGRQNSSWADTRPMRHSAECKLLDVSRGFFFFFFLNRPCAFLSPLSIQAHPKWVSSSAIAQSKVVKSLSACLIWCSSRLTWSICPLHQSLINAALLDVHLHKISDCGGYSRIYNKSQMCERVLCKFSWFDPNLMACLSHKCERVQIIGESKFISLVWMLEVLYVRRNFLRLQ